MFAWLIFVAIALSRISKQLEVIFNLLQDRLGKHEEDHGEMTE